MYFSQRFQYNFSIICAENYDGEAYQGEEGDFAGETFVMFVRLGDKSVKAPMLTGPFFTIAWRFLRFRKK
jgi:hypothetical protein